MKRVESDPGGFELKRWELNERRRFINFYGRNRLKDAGIGDEKFVFEGGMIPTTGSL
jgi:hypothetical protein